MDENKHTAASRYCELLRRHERMLRWLCLRRAFGDPSLADDYYQEVALSLWRQLPSFMPDIPLRQERAYVKEAARFVLSRCSRKRHPDLRVLQAEMITTFGQIDNGDSENEQLLNAFTDALPEGERLTVGLYRAGYSVTEIALFLNISPNAASHRLRRAIERMCEMYEKECNTINRMHHE